MLRRRRTCPGACSALTPRRTTKDDSLRSRGVKASIHGIFAEYSRPRRRREPPQTRRKWGVIQAHAYEPQFGGGVDPSPHGKFVGRQRRRHEHAVKHRGHDVGAGEPLTSSWPSHRRELVQAQVTGQATRPETSPTTPGMWAGRPDPPEDGAGRRGSPRATARRGATCCAAAVAAALRVVLPYHRRTPSHRGASQRR